jgi:hypothetical protein
VRITSHGESDQARIAAAKELIDRGFGRPAAGKGEEDKKINVIVHGRCASTSERPAVILPREQPALEDGEKCETS